MLTYIDCASGVAGDMLIGAMAGLGLPVRELERTLQAAFGVKGWSLKVTSTERRFWPAWSVQVVGDRHYGSVDKMRACVKRAALPVPVKKNATEILNRMEAAERKAHGKAVGEFDDEGLALLDTLVDVVGTCWGFWKLNIQDVTASPVNTGRAAPATAVMIKENHLPIYSTSPLELATPTGIAVLLQFAKEFKAMPEMHLEKTGYGAGSENPRDRANVVTIHQGHPTLKKGGGGDFDTANPSQPPFAKGRSFESVLLLETVIDDMDPRLYPHVMDLLLKAGALDTWWTPIGMKKGRPGIAFAVLCRPVDEIKLKDLLFRETTTLGIRRQLVERWVLPRKTEGLRKVALLPGGRSKSQTEFEKVRKVSSNRVIPLLKLLK